MLKKLVLCILMYVMYVILVCTKYEPWVICLQMTLVSKHVLISRTLLQMVARAHLLTRTIEHVFLFFLSLLPYSYQTDI